TSIHWYGSMNLLTFTIFLRCRPVLKIYCLFITPHPRVRVCQVIFIGQELRPTITAVGAYTPGCPTRHRFYPPGIQMISEEISTYTPNIWDPMATSLIYQLPLRSCLKNLSPIHQDLVYTVIRFSGTQKHF